jgi:hypothetical protein
MEKLKKFKKLNTNPHGGVRGRCALSPLNNLNYFIFFYLYRYTRGLGVRDRSRKFKKVQESSKMQGGGMIQPPFPIGISCESK